MKSKLIYSGVDWKKVCMAQSKKWASKSGPVKIIKKGDPTKGKKKKGE